MNSTASHWAQGAGSQGFSKVHSFLSKKRLCAHQLSQNQAWTLHATAPQGTSQTAVPSSWHDLRCKLSGKLSEQQSVIFRQVLKWAFMKSCCSYYTQTPLQEEVVAMIQNFGGCLKPSREKTKGEFRAVHPTVWLREEPCWICPVPNSWLAQPRTFHLQRNEPGDH